MSLAAAASIIVGAAFLVAGAAKIAAGAQWPVQARMIGAPAAVIPFVPWVEIVVGGLLGAQVTRPIVGSVALVMLVAFTAVLGLRLKRGERPPCACFGSWSAKPLGWRHLVRNAVLIVCAIIAIAA